MIYIHAYNTYSKKGSVLSQVFWELCFATTYFLAGFSNIAYDHEI